MYPWCPLPLFGKTISGQSHVKTSIFVEPKGSETLETNEPSTRLRMARTHGRQVVSLFNAFRIFSMEYVLRERRPGGSQRVAASCSG